MDSAACWMSFTFATVASTTSRPSSAAFFRACSAWISLFTSLAQYMRPMRFAPGTNFMPISTCSSTGPRSFAPVTFVPGFSLDLTSFAVSKSVMATPTMGMSRISLATDCAAGVEMAMITSGRACLKRDAMFFRLD